MEHFISAIKVAVFIALSFLVVATLLKAHEEPSVNPCTTLENEAWHKLYSSEESRTQLVETIKTNMECSGIEDKTTCWHAQQIGPQILKCEAWLSTFKYGAIPSFPKKK
jgi:hypothetical protein